MRDGTGRANNPQPEVPRNEIQIRQRLKLRPGRSAGIEPGEKIEWKKLEREALPASAGGGVLSRQGFGNEDTLSLNNQTKLLNAGSKQVCTLTWLAVGVSA